MTTYREPDPLTKITAERDALLAECESLRKTRTKARDLPWWAWLTGALGAFSVGWSLPPVDVAIMVYVSIFSGMGIAVFAEHVAKTIARGHRPSDEVAAEWTKAAEEEADDLDDYEWDVEVIERRGLPIAAKVNGMRYARVKTLTAHGDVLVWCSEDGEEVWDQDPLYEALDGALRRRRRANEVAAILDMPEAAQ